MKKHRLYGDARAKHLANLNIIRKEAAIANASIDHRHERGAVSELLACAWLVQRGFRVFRNVCPSGPADIVAIKDGHILQFDVKTALKGQRFELTAAQYQLGVLPFYVCEDGSCEAGRLPVRITESFVPPLPEFIGPVKPWGLCSKCHKASKHPPYRWCEACLKANALIAR